MNKISLIIFLIIAALFGIVLAVDIGQANYEQLGIYVSIGIVIYFFVKGWQNVWWFTAFLIFSGATFIHSFEFTADNLFVMMLALASGMFVISRGGLPQADEFKRAGSRSTATIFGILLLYGVIHLMAYYANPFSPNEYSFKTSSKAYFEYFAPMACFFWLLVGPYGFTLKPNWPKTLIIIMGLCLLGNVIIRGVLFLQGFQAADGLDDGQTHFYSLYIPVINMYPGVYTLRNIPPIATVILLMLVTSPGWWQLQSKSMKLWIATSLLLCLIGALFSGGRFTLVFCIMLAGLVALMRRKIVICVAMAMAGVLIAALINIFSHQINEKAPYYVARSVQFLMIDKGESYSSIGDSQNVRDRAAKAAFEEWKSDTQIFLFGRSVFSITWAEAEYNRNRFGHDGFVINALRSGRTHNLLTDLLIQYGLIGCTLYLMAYAMSIRFLFRLYRTIPTSEGVVRSIVGGTAIYLFLQFPYQLLGGGYPPAVVPLIIGLSRAHLLTLRASIPADSPAQSPKPVLPRPHRPLPALANHRR